MGFEISTTWYKVSLDENNSNYKTYVGTKDLEKGGFLIEQEYYCSKDFDRDLLNTIILDYKNQFIEYIIDNNYSSTLQDTNQLLDALDSAEILCKLNNDISRRFIDRDKLTNYIDNGIFHTFGPLTKIIQIIAI